MVLACLWVVRAALGIATILVVVSTLAPLVIALPALLFALAMMHWERFLPPRTGASHVVRRRST